MNRQQRRASKSKKGGVLMRADLKNLHEGKGSNN
jgi:hypothetical protein